MIKLFPRSVIHLIIGAVIALVPSVAFCESGTVSADLFKGLTYRCVGPTRGGRVTAVAGIPSRSGTFFLGATGGGVWKTTDFGTNWTNVSDGYFTTGSIGAVRVSASDPDIVYVGTGSDAIRSNVITGRGMYKSKDGGKTWSFIGLKNTGQIGALEIHPGNPDIVYVAALGQAFGPNPERGVFRTKNGGETWEKVLFVSERTGAVDLELAPGNPNILYASLWQAMRKPWSIISGGREGGVFRSLDGGDTWKRVTEGLPLGLVGKSDLAVSPADPERVYVLMEAPEPDGGLYRSDDCGQSFRLVSTYTPLLDRPFYYCNLDADPSDADILYSNATRFFRSTDGGNNWKRLSTPHGDNHDMWINPEDPDLFIQANDGGANITRDGGTTWSTQNNQPTAELYQVAVDDQFPYWLYAGQQDNSTIMVPSFPPYTPAAGSSAFWRTVGGCETGPAVPKPGNPDIVYSNCKGKFGRYNKRTGQEKQYAVGAANIYGHNPKDLKFRFQRVSPIHVSPHNPDVVYHASQYVHRTKDEGVTWETISPDLTANEPDKQVISGSPITRDITGEEYYSTIYALQESVLQEGLIWVGANDGPVHVTRDGGLTWADVTPAGLPPGGRVQTVEPSPHRPEKAYIAVYRYLLADWAPYIYKTEDFGRTWTRLTTGTNGIPSDNPTRVIREDPHREGLLYAGTEFGMYISFDDGLQWQPFQLNLPVTPVTDIKIHRNDLVLSTMGRSFWIMDNITPLYEMNEQTIEEKAVLFKPSDAYRIRSGGFRRFSDAVPEYPSPGVHFDYYLSRTPTEELKLVIQDETGAQVCAFFSQQGNPRLPAKGEMIRFIWDMRRGSGPLVLPGDYTVTLTDGQFSRTARFSILMDPRIEEDGVTISDLRAQEQLLLKIADLRTASNVVLKDVKTKIQAVESAERSGETRNRRLLASLHDIRSRLETADGPYPQPKIIDQISSLYGMLSQADQKPGKDAWERYDELLKAVKSCRDEFKTITEGQRP
ncbi:MAG: hypothetical protein MUP70_07290 [Candidatus Aminicenantes bacterium]|nr:hypothetical protein [Candidatus Aminicenantes bacterium]